MKINDIAEGMDSLTFWKREAKKAGGAANIDWYAIGVEHGKQGIVMNPPYGVGGKAVALYSKGLDAGQQGVAEGSDKLQGTPVVSLSDFSDKDTKKDKYGRTVPKKLKKDDPRVKFHKDEKKGVAEGSYGRSSYYNPMDYERDQQDQMDWGKRAFKRAELQHELGHEDDPNFERNLRQQQIDRDRGPWYIRINGKIYHQKGEPKSFDWKRGANNYALAMLKNKPDLQGKIMLTKNNDNVTETGELKVQKDDDKSTVLLNPATGVQTQIDKTNPNSPRLTQDNTGKLKLSTGQSTDQAKPNLVGKDVTVDSPPVEEDSFNQLLTQQLRKLAGL